MGYRVDLAYIHDEGFGTFARDAAPGIIGWLHEAGIDHGHVVDLGCGSGILARHLLDAGYSVTGIDLSDAMIQIALRRAPGARYVRASFLDADIPPCRAVTSTGECLSYLLDERNSPHALALLFDRVYQALDPGGLFIFDVCVAGRSRGMKQASFEGEDWSLMTKYAIDESSQVLTRTISTERRIDGQIRCDSEVHRVRLYDEEVLRRCLTEAGFDVRIERAYGDFELYEGTAAFVAAKPL